MTPANKEKMPVESVDVSDVIKIAVLAVGGQGGGVLTNWISDLGTRAGYAVQMTSVAGVAQRTGATIYYVEMTPKSEKLPVFALSPSPGDLDVLIAAELMEAGRAVLRGFITPDRTTLIASSHRILAVSEKQVPGDGRSDHGLVEDKIIRAALQSVCFDMEKIAVDAGSMISASLFGGLAKSGALPFETTLYEEVIEASGRGIKQSLAAFRDALNFDETDASQANIAKTVSKPSGPPNLVDEWSKLTRAVENFPVQSRDMALAGLRKVVDFQDIAYGEEYLDRLRPVIAVDVENRDYALTVTAAKYVANAMCYDDILRVADLKTRSSRNVRLRKEQQASLDQIVHVTEYFHPRAQELCGTLPASIGAWIEDSPRVFKVLQRVLDKGRRIRTDGLLGFCSLWFVSAFRPFRRKLLRHRYETHHLENLIETTLETATSDYGLAVEVLSCQRLVKGYSDTHIRGHSKFKKVIGSLSSLKGRGDAADWIRRLREVALRDEKGEGLDGALETVASFAK